MDEASAPSASPTKNMVWVPGGTFRMGPKSHYPEEAPVRDATVGGFWMDEHPVTNLEFTRFVKATGHVTFAERAPDPEKYPGAKPEMLVAGSIVFKKSAGPVDLTYPYNWWDWKHGADWRHPEGPGSSTARPRAASCRPRRLRATPRRTRAGRARSFRRRRSGSSRRAAAWMARSSPGATR